MAAVRFCLLQDIARWPRSADRLDRRACRRRSERNGARGRGPVKAENRLFRSGADRAAARRVARARLLSVLNLQLRPTDDVTGRINVHLDCT